MPDVTPVLPHRHNLEKLPDALASLTLHNLAAQRPSSPERGYVVVPATTGHAKVVPFHPSSVAKDAPWNRLWADDAALRKAYAVPERAREAEMLSMDRTQSPPGSAEAIEDVAKMLETVGCALVGRPGNVRVKAVSREREVRFTLTVDRADLEKVAGPQGRTAASLKVIVRAAGIKHHRVFTLSIRCVHAAKTAC